MHGTPVGSSNPRTITNLPSSSSKHTHLKRPQKTAELTSNSTPKVSVTSTSTFKPPRPARKDHRIREIDPFRNKPPAPETNRRRIESYNSPRVPRQPPGNAGLQRAFADNLKSSSTVYSKKFQLNGRGFGNVYQPRKWGRP